MLRKKVQKIFHFYLHFTCLCALQICTVELQWKYIEKTVLLKNYSFLLLIILHCIFHMLKIVTLALFSMANEIIKESWKKIALLKIWERWFHSEVSKLTSANHLPKWNIFWHLHIFWVGAIINDFLQNPHFNDFYSH